MAGRTMNRQKLGPDLHGESPGALDQVANEII